MIDPISMIELKLLFRLSVPGCFDSMLYDANICYRDLKVWDRSIEIAGKKYGKYGKEV